MLNGQSRHSRIKLFCQRILTNDQVDRFEILARLCLDDGQIIPASTWISQIVACPQLSVQFDWFIISQILAKRPVNVQVWLNCLPVTLSDSAFAERFNQRVKASLWHTEQICIEVGEHADPSSDRTQLRQTLQRLAQMGYQIALDDYGKRASDVEAILSYPLDWVKLTGETLRYGESVAFSNFVETLQIYLRRQQLGLIVEWVETPEQKALLDNLRVHGLQGNLIQPPHPWSLLGQTGQVDQ